MIVKNAKFLQEKKKKKIYIYKWKNQRGCIDSLFRTENRCVLFDSFTCIYSALLPQHWALYAKVDSTPTFIRVYIYIYIYINKYYERKKRRNYISRQACFVNRFTLQGFNEIYIYVCMYKMKTKCVLGMAWQMKVYLSICLIPLTTRGLRCNISF